MALVAPTCWLHLDTSSGAGKLAEYPSDLRRRWLMATTLDRHKFKQSETAN